MSPTNGEAKIKARDLTFSDKLNVLLEAVADLADQVQKLQDQLDEQNEKLSNLSLENDGWEVQRFSS